MQGLCKSCAQNCLRFPSYIYIPRGGVLSRRFSPTATPSLLTQFQETVASRYMLTVIHHLFQYLIVGSFVTIEGVLLWFVPHMN